MKEQPEVEYGGARLAVEIDQTQARLRINGRVREAAALGPDTLRLASTVQTDYEWHEFIEAVITVEGDEIVVSLLANKQEILNQRMPRP